MRKKFTPLLLIPGFFVFFACSKHESRPSTPIASADTVFTQLGNVNATIANNNFQSLNFISAYDANGIMNILARAIINKDTCELSIDFSDTLHPNTAYISSLTSTTEIIGSDTFNVNSNQIYFYVGFYDTYLGTEYLSGAGKNFTGDTLVITNFDRANHLIAGTFKSTVTASRSESPYITETTADVSGAFNTNYSSK